MQPFLYIIDIISIILEVVLVVSYLRMFLKSRVSKMSEFLACVGYVMISAIIVLFTNIEIIFFLRNFLLMFAMSFLFSAKLWKRILLTLVLIILIMTTEVLVGITTSSLTGMEMGQIQSNIFYYLQGVVITKLLLLVLIKASKHYISPSDTQISKPTIMF